MPQKRYIVIGDGAAGTTVAQSLRAADKSATIAIVSDDPHAAYFRAALTNYLLGELREEQVWAVPPTFYEEHAIHRALARVAKVDTQRSLLWLAQGGRPIGYDSLVIASGARARPPTFEGAWLPGVMTMRTLQDVHRVMDLIQLKGLRTAVIIGGGPLALEWAHGLAHRGVKVVLVVRDTRFLPSAIDNVASDLLLARLRSAGVQVRLGDEVLAAMPGPQGRIAGVTLKSGERVACELLGVAIGVIVNSEFLEGSGIKLAPNGGIEVDDQMRTNLPNIYAAGDCAAFQGKLLQLWEPARMQARIVAATIQGRSERYVPGAHYMATRLYDLDCASVGDIGASQDVTEIVDFPQRTGRVSYRKLCIRNGRLVGALMFGEREVNVRRLGRSFKRLVDSKVDITSIREELLDPAFDLSAWMHQNDLTQKPKVERANTSISAAAGKMKGTHAINLEDLPPLPGVISRKAPASADAPAKGIPSIPPAFSDNVPAPRVILEGPQGQIEVRPPSAIVGRDPSSAVPLQDPSVSWRHAEMTIASARAFVRDLGSGTGTWVNGQAVTVPRVMRDGDKIRIGNTELTVRIVSSDGSRTSSAAGVASSANAGEPKPHLTVRTGRSIGLSFELAIDLVTIGRDPASTIRLDDESVDFRHAWIRRTPSGWDIADAESHGITKKNGLVLATNQWVTLTSGDHVEIGEVAMVYEVRSPDLLPALLAPVSVAYGARALPDHRASAPPATPVARASSRPHEPTVARARLLVRHGPNPGSAAELSDRTVIGSQPGQATLVLADPRIGPRHLEIFRHGDGFYARDLGSQRGTACRGQAIGQQPFKLLHGDVVILGPNAIHLLFEALS